MDLSGALRLCTLAAALAACSGNAAGGSTSGTTGSGGGSGSPADAGTDAADADASTKKYALKVNIVLTDDGKGVALFTQNGSMVHVPKADIVGKTLIWATTPAGEPVGNTKPIDFGLGKMGADLKASFTTPAHYANGAWEMANVISITGADPTKGPQPGDLAAFDITPPPAGEPPITGVSVRMRVHDADAEVTLVNASYIRF